MSSSTESQPTLTPPLASHQVSKPRGQLLLTLMHMFFSEESPLFLAKGWEGELLQDLQCSGFGCCLWNRDLTSLACDPQNTSPSVTCSMNGTDSRRLPTAGGFSSVYHSVPSFSAKLGKTTRSKSTRWLCFPRNSSQEFKLLPLNESELWSAMTVGTSAHSQAGAP